MDWYTVVAALAAVYIPSLFVLWWIFTYSSEKDHEHDPY
jgi:hypothetical protein